MIRHIISKQQNTFKIYAYYVKYMHFCNGNCTSFLLYNPALINNSYKLWLLIIN